MTTDSTNPAALSAEQLDTFHREGVLALPSRFSVDEVAALTAALEELIADDIPQNIREKSSGVVRSSFELHRRHPLYERLVNDPRFVVPAHQILVTDPCTPCR